MKHFIVSARKYRPQNFDDVVGQQAITNTLENAIKNNHLAQALLFTGPRGVGKTSCARILAKKINQVTSSSNSKEFSFNIFELDAASNNSVDDIRSLTDQVRIPPQIGKYKVYIIDEVHMLSQTAFNAFLKTLEEPPAHAIFILATTEKHKIIPTILSRCQIFDFKRINVIDIKKYLKKISQKEGISADDDGLHIIAQKADGAMRDALSIFDRVVSFCGNNLTKEAVNKNLNVLDYQVYFEITDLLLKNKIPEVLITFNEVLSKGFEGNHFINGLASHFRDLLVAKDKETIKLLEVSDNAKKKYKEQSINTSMEFLLSAIDKANECDLKYRSSKNQRLLVELAIMQIASITFDGEKKKSKNYIIPSIFFSKEKKIEQKIINVEKTTKEITPKITKPLDKIKRRPSALSLNSINKKRLIKKDLIIEKNTNDNIRDSFNETQLRDAWQEYYLKLQNLGRKNFASILNSNKPIYVSNNIISITLANSSMKNQLENEKPKLLAFLKEKLNNYGIKLNIKVDSTIEKEYIYHTSDKFKKMCKKNPSLYKLKEIFNLDI